MVMVVTASHCNEILKTLRDEVTGGHLGQDKTLGRLKKRFY